MRYILFLVSLILTGFLGWGVFAHAEAAPVLFTRDLRVGTRGTDVRALQQFLNNQDTPVAIAGPGSRGQETDYFGVRTQQALARYQERHADSILKPLGLNKVSGLFLQATRNQINASNKRVTIPPVTTTSTNVVGHILGGQISGLRGSVVVHNQGETIRIGQHDDGNFVFPQRLNSGTPYVITVTNSAQMPQFCFVSANGTGVITRDVTDVRIMCYPEPGWDPFTVVGSGGASTSYTVGGTVSGLIGTLVLQNNGGDSLTVSSDGSFTFNTALRNYSTYSISIATAPTSTDETCTLSNGSGTVSGQNITSASISCSTRPTISLDSVTKTYGDSSFVVTASSTSNGTITYSSSDPSVATISGSTVTIVGAGSATITASQAATTYYSATSTTASLTVAKATPVITTISNMTLDSSDYSGLCFYNSNATVHECIETYSNNITFPTSTSNAEFTALYSANVRVLPATSTAISYAGYNQLSAFFNFDYQFTLAFPYTTTAISSTVRFYQPANSNYTEASSTFSITINPVSSDSDTALSCVNNGVLLRNVSGYECLCSSAFTGDRCQTPVISEA